MDDHFPKILKKMVMKQRAHDLTRYSWKGPGHGRVSFTIYKDIKCADGRRQCHTIDDERITAINRAYQSGGQSYDTCRIQIKEIVAEFYKELERERGIVVHNHENLKLFEEFWAKEYAHRTLIEPYATDREFKRYIFGLGSLSLYSASRDEIQEKIDAKFKGNIQRRAVQRITQILRFIGRQDIRLRRNRPEHYHVTYLTQDEFNQLLVFVESPVERALMTLCFYSGVRIGEAYALDARSFRAHNNTIRVINQIDRHEIKRHTKTRRERTAYLCPEGVEAFHVWVKISDEERKAEINRQQASRNLMKKYCRMAFPDDETKHLTFHALRHCYAIHLLSCGVSLSLVAQSLGNSLTVCQQYYTGFELTTDSIEAINNIMKKSKKDD